MPSFTATKLLWLKRHEPEAFQRACHLLLPASYINYWLTGNMAMEVRMDSIMVVLKCGFWAVKGAPQNTVPRGGLHLIGVFSPLCSSCLISLFVPPDLSRQAGDASGTGFLDVAGRCGEEKAAGLVDGRVGGMLPPLLESNQVGVSEALGDSSPARFRARM